MLVALCSVKSAGVTTAALGLATVLPRGSRPVVVECDPTGGDVARRHGLDVTAGVVELAAFTRAGGRGGDDLGDYAQTIRLADRSVPVVVAPPGGAGVRVALEVLARPGQPTLTGTDRTVIVDCGRLVIGSPVWPLLGLADAVWVLVRARVDELAHLREHLPELARVAGSRVRVVLAAGGVYRPVEVAEALSDGDATVTVVGPLPYDEGFARAAAGETGRRLRRRVPLLAALDDLVTSEFLATAGPDVASVSPGHAGADRVVT